MAAPRTWSGVPQRTQRHLGVVGGQTGEVVGDDGAVPVAVGPVAQQGEELVVADGGAQHVQGDRAALVDAVVEHVPRPGIGQQQVLR